MFIHRPFLSFSSYTTITTKHITTCLSTARTQIDILYSAFTHRHYLRTWWYNATHTLYASVIILCVLLLDDFKIMSTIEVTKAELTKDIQKALQIIRAMEAMPVATRYADLLVEMLAVVSKGTVDDDESGLAENLQCNVNHNHGATGNVVMKGRFSGVNEPSSQAHRQEGITVSDDQNSGLARDGLLASLINTNSFEDFGMGSDNLMFGNMEGWNVAGNIFSDFNFTGENADAALWG